MFLIETLGSQAVGQRVPYKRRRPAFCGQTSLGRRGHLREVCIMLLFVPLIGFCVFYVASFSFSAVYVAFHWLLARCYRKTAVALIKVIKGSALSIWKPSQNYPAIELHKEFMRNKYTLA